MSSEVGERKQALVAALSTFVSSWTAHGQAVAGAFAVLYDRFVILSSDSRSFVSGCSIDGLFRAVSDAVALAGLELSDFSSLQYRSGEKIVETSREDFGSLVKEGKINGDTLVFDNSIQTLSGIRNGKWELAASQSWHKSAFDL